MPQLNCVPAVRNVPAGSNPTGTPLRAGWPEAEISDHFVQFYRDDYSLVESVTGFMAAGLRAVEGGILIATPDHRRAIVQRLEKQGLPLELAMIRKQFVTLDAEATLATFMVDGMPDERLFHRTVGYVVCRMLSAGYRVRAFGEMVALLRDDNPAAALRLEQLWNDLGRTHRFSVMCAYPLAQFPDGTGDVGYQHVCAVHTAVIPAR